MLSIKRPGPGRPRLHKKRLRDLNGPKAPLSGYLQFVVDRRHEITTKSGPDEDITERTSLATLAAEWKALDPKIRNNYIKQSEQERIKYRQELEEYKKSDTYKQFLEKVKESRKAASSRIKMANLTSKDNGPKTKFNDETFAGDIPIFTKEFLEHNKDREAEIRRLRAEIIRLEEEEQALKNNVNQLRLAREQSQADLQLQRQQIDALQRQFSAYSKVLLNVFSKLPMPGFEEGMSPSNMDNYLNKLQELITHSSADNQSILLRARDLVKKVKLPSF